ncbi:MATE family efflux transporter [Lysobacter sp. TY2-98]|uniref:MATE family efflux transporter n=1 Tax=Lysobacter sp. TY2-98 TaxID=2290922 RepID=UPI000E1FE43F|nr:MATE family efflux transporter [Lysobacter sp. TY2-98]AXK73640.1 MATE family efflux transporter [Lysobacter sp. TY2-98]
MSPRHNLTEGPIARTLFLFALPILGGNVLQSLNGSINAVWVGRFLGEQALTATANANNVLFLVLGAVFGVGMAASILVAQAIGRNDLTQARCVIGTSATFFISLSVLIAAVGLPFSRHLLAGMDTPPSALPFAEAYLRIIFLALPFLYAFTFITAILRGSGDTRTPFIFLLLTVALDIGFNPVLLFGLGPFPKMGIAGAATATLIANATALSALLLWLRHKKHRLWISRGERHLYRPNLTVLKSLIGKGIPIGLQMMLISVAMLAMITMVNKLGVETTAAYGASLQLWTYVQMPAMAIGAACSSMAAQNVGANRWDRVHSIAKSGVLFNFLMTGALIVPLVVFSHATLSLFLPATSPALVIAQHLDPIVITSFLFFGVTFVLSGVVRATGAVIPPLVILAFALWGVRVPYASLLQSRMGADAIWWSFPVSAVVAMALSALYYVYGGWRKAKMLPVAHDEVAVPAEVPAMPPSPVADVASCDEERTGVGGP